MAVEVIDTLKPKNNGTFPVVEAEDVEVSEGVRLPEALEQKAEQTDLEELSGDLANKVSTSEFNTATTSLQAQIDQIAQAAGTGSADTEVAQARVDADGVTHTTLKERIDNDVTVIKNIIGDNNYKYESGYFVTAYNYIGDHVDSDNYATIKIPVVKGQVISITGHGASEARLWAIADADGLIIRKADENATASNLELTIVDGECWLVTNVATAYTHKCVSLTPIVSQIDNIKEKINADLDTIGKDKSDKTALTQTQLGGRWWKAGDEVFSALSESKRTNLLKILDFSVNSYIDGVTVQIYNLKIESDGSFTMGVKFTSIDGSVTFPIELPASNSVTTFTTTQLYKRCKIDISITYTTKDNIEQTILRSDQLLEVEVLYAGAKFSNGQFDNRIIPKIYISDEVAGLKLIRTQNQNPSQSGSTFWYYAQYQITFKNGETKTFTQSSTTEKTGIIEDNLNNYVIVFVNADILALYKTFLQAVNASISLLDSSYYLDGSLSNKIINNLQSDGIDNLPDCEIYKNGVASPDNYGEDNVIYKFNVGKDRKNIHIFFEYQWTEAPVYVDDSKFYTFAKVYGDLFSAVQYFRAINGGSLRRAFLIGSNNLRWGSETLSPTEADDNLPSGNIAFTMQYTGGTATASTDVTCRFTNNTVRVYHADTDEEIGSISYLPSDSVDSLIESLNTIEGVSCEAIETTEHICSELLLTEETTTFALKKTYKNSGNVNQYDYPKLGIYYAQDNSWHTCEIIVDIENALSYVAFDGRTVMGHIRTDLETDQTIEIGGLFNGTESPIRLRNLEVNYDSFGDAEIINSVAPPYTAKKQLISSHNPRLLIFEGHGVDIGIDADAPYSDNMAVTTDRLNKVFSYLKEKGYVPVSWQEIIDWKCGNGKLPKRCYNIMMDDWRFENYVDYVKRQPFERYNVKAGLAVVPTMHSTSDTVEIDGVNYTVSDIIRMTMNAGWYPCSHTKNHRNNLDVKPSELENLLKEDALANDLYGIYSNVMVYPYGSYNVLIGREVMRSAFKIGVNIVINTYNCKMTNNANLARVEIGTRQTLSDVLAPIV